ncbi:MAG: sortase [Chloroflexota bacterium]
MRRLIRSITFLKSILLALILAATLVNPAQAADGDLDFSFNVGAGTRGTDNIVQALAIQPDGKVIIGGLFTTYDGDGQAPDRILRLNTNGTLDTTFNYGAGTLGTDNTVWTTAIQPDGRILIGGAFTTYNGDAQAPDRILRLNPDGSIDTTFNYGAGTRGASSIVYAIRIQPDGRILIGGAFTSYNGNTQAPDRILRLNAIGTLDTTFNYGAGTRGTDNIVQALAIQPDGRILVAGQFLAYDGDAQAPDRILRLNADSTLDTTFNYGAGTRGLNNTTYALALQPDGKIVVAGTATTYDGNGQAPDRILRLNTDGTLDTAFNVGAGTRGTNNTVRAVLLQPDGRILLGGLFTTYNGNGQAPDRVLRLLNNLAPTDIQLSNTSIDENLPPGTVVGLLSTIDPNSGDTFTYSLVSGVPGCDSSGNGSFQISGNQLQNAVSFDYETQNSYTVCIRTTDSGGLTYDKQFTVTINDIDEIVPAVSSILRLDPNPTNLASVTFSVTFSENVTGVDTTDFSLTTTGVSGASVTNVSGSGSTYTVTVNTGSGSGTLRLDVVDDDSIVDAVSNPLGGVGAGNGDYTTSEAYTIERTGPVVVFGVNTVPANNAVLTTGPAQITVEYSEDVKNDASTGAANNIANYLLVEAGADGTFDTMTCAGGLVADDTQIAINSAMYNNSGGAGPFVATLSLNGGVPLQPGNYRLLICGTTSIEDLLGNELNDGASDAQLEFTVGRTAAMPSTSFAPGRVTILPAQTDAYAASGLVLEIPRLNVQMKIVGVPQVDGGWDVTWLNRDAGWLQGTAFPTWAGNSVITAHVYDAYGQAGPFVRLNQLWYGDRVVVRAWGQEYVYEVRSVRQVRPGDTASLTRHEEHPWLTLITCRGYDETTDSYRYRVIVQAVLMEIR